MAIVVCNGEPFEVEEGTPLVAFLHSLGLGERTVVVERNGEALVPSAMAGVRLADGDRLEVVRAVAGG